MCAAFEAPRLLSPQLWLPNLSGEACLISPRVARATAKVLDGSGLGKDAAAVLSAGLRSFKDGDALAPGTSGTALWLRPRQPQCVISGSSYVAGATGFFLG